ncbi:hypothetical protein [Bartonella sp. DGB2]|uniref:hypothetical protein n=1 Tax=Bartonella sp. DGB2 TaxID=3388426 RepID=UPI00399020AC
MSFLPIAEYRPDVATANTNFSDDIRNVLPADGSYIPMPGLTPLSAPIPEAHLNSFATRTLTGATLFFAGTPEKLYLLDNTGLAWRDVSREDTPYSANNEAPWSFAAFGNYIIAVNKNDSPQIYQVGASTRFEKLKGNPPRAGIVKIWGDFVCLMQLTDKPNRVWWSGLNNIEWWTPGQYNCDYQDFPEGGIVQGAMDATNPVIFLQSAIYRATFIPGSDIIFSFQKIHTKRGARSSTSIAGRGNMAFYADQGGFFQIDTNGTINSIGFEKVDRTVFNQLNANTLSTLSAVIDPFYNRVYWACDYDGNGTVGEILVYDWGLEKWSSIHVNILAILPFYTLGKTLESLDEVSPSLDDLPYSLDSKAWQGGAPLLGAIDLDNKLCSFTDLPLEATLSSPEIRAPNGAITRLHTVYPECDSDVVLISIGTRRLNNTSCPILWSQDYRPSPMTGRVLLHARARYHKVRVRIPPRHKWSHISGFDIQTRKSGIR